MDTQWPRHKSRDGCQLRRTHEGMSLRCWHLPSDFPVTRQPINFEKKKKILSDGLITGCWWWMSQMIKTGVVKSVCISKRCVSALDNYNIIIPENGYSVVTTIISWTFAWQASDGLSIINESHLDDWLLGTVLRILRLPGRVGLRSLCLISNMEPWCQCLIENTMHYECTLKYYMYNTNLSLLW